MSPYSLVSLSQGVHNMKSFNINGTWYRASSLTEAFVMSGIRVG